MNEEQGHASDTVDAAKAAVAGEGVSKKDAPIAAKTEEPGYISERLLAVISYFGFFWVSLFPKFDTKYTRYHANQGLVLAVMLLAFELFLRILRFPFSWFNAPTLSFVVNIVFTVVGMALPAVFIIIGAFNAYKGALSPLPIIGKIRIIC